MQASAAKNVTAFIGAVACASFPSVACRPVCHRRFAGENFVTSLRRDPVHLSTVGTVETQAPHGRPAVRPSENARPMGRRGWGLRGDKLQTRKIATFAPTRTLVIYALCMYLY